MDKGTQMYVYVISAGDACKIGVAKDVDSRIVSLRTGSPVSLAIEHSMRCKNSRVAYTIEKTCHRILSDKRLEGEWFSCAPMGAVMALNEAVLEFAANDYGYVDMPRGGELALSSKSARYVKAMCRGFGLKVSDVVDEALVEHFGPIVDGPQSHGKSKAASAEAHIDKVVLEALNGGPLPISKLKAKKGLGTLDDKMFHAKISEMERRGVVVTTTAGKGVVVSIRPKSNSTEYVH